MLLPYKYVTIVVIVWLNCSMTAMVLGPGASLNTTLLHLCFLHTVEAVYKSRISFCLRKIGAMSHQVPSHT